MMKLDRFLAHHLRCSRRDAHFQVAAGRVRVDGVVSTDGHHLVGKFSRVEFDGRVLSAATPRYLMLHKPAGVVSATRDPEHPTALDLIDAPWKDELHIAGRLDRASTGLLLLTNDSGWSEQLTRAASKVEKVYLVETAEPIAPEAAEGFAEGFYFHTEDITTRPAGLVVTGERTARVTLHEGRYHQVKRMFHRVGNRVVSLHRERIGEYCLPDDLAPGQWREIEQLDESDRRGGSFPLS